MPRLSKEFKQAIQTIPLEELQKIVLKAASKDSEIFDFININYIDKSGASEDLFEQTKEKVSAEIYFVRDRGTVQKNLGKAITKAIGHINHFSKVTKNEIREAELLVFLIDKVFKSYTNELGTCWTVFDSKLAITTNRLYNLVTKKLHEDYQIEFTEPINRFLSVLHSKSNHLDYVYNMPKTL